MKNVNGILTLDMGSVADAVLMAFVFAVLTALVSLVHGGNFDVFSADWLSIGKSMVNVGFAAAVLSLGQSLLSGNNGSLLGITPPNTSA